MADKLMTPLDPEDAEGRNVVHTGLSTVGLGKHNYYCGHCGEQIMHKMDVSNFSAAIVFQCSVCDGLNVNPDIAN